ncbi:transcription-repair coupling factor [Marivibrio halodurans]|uniref:transcription-repair coupling factor n=1 Tax=Marivibrio halodurans TaxID=2039722 RepID=UPI003618038D
MTSLSDLTNRPGPATIAGAPEGADALVLAHLARAADAPILFVGRDETRMARMGDLLGFIDPELRALSFPAWDCLPYDRVSPNSTSVARRLETLTRLAGEGGAGRGTVLLTTVAAVTQRVPTRERLKDAALVLKPGDSASLDLLSDFFTKNGYRRADTVREAGEYAVRGGILDVFPPGEEEPLRLDFFGDELETVRRFDAMSQRSTGETDGLSLKPVSEIMLDRDSIDRFRQAYRRLFGGSTEGDQLFEAVSEGRRPPGVEHWLPLFHEGMETLFDYLPEGPVILDHQSDEAVTARLDLVRDHHAARQEDLEIALKRKDADAPPLYKPLPPDMLYLTDRDWKAALDRRAHLHLTPFAADADLAASAEVGDIVDFGAHRVPDFAAARTDPNTNIYEAVAARVKHQGAKPTLIAAASEGSRERLKLLLGEGGLKDLPTVPDWSRAVAQPGGVAGIAVLNLDHGFETDGIQLITESDILGERMARPARRRRRGEEFISELSAIEVGDIVVHVDHGIGRYDGLETLTVDGAPHDCLRLIYSGGDKLFLPVENLEVLTKYGSEDSEVQLDKLGGVAWQARKARIKERVREMADQLLKIAAQRQLKKADQLSPTEGAYDEFVARFPFAETEDQARAIEDVAEDLQSGKPMDRLICGDVGFGKTEVALRAAFLAVMNGLQVAVVVPTTLLARQHYKLFRERFQGLPVKIGQLSRLATPKEAAETKAGLSDGTLDIVVGTHAVLSKSVSFRHLGLMIVDEEQHFGVGQKERLKQLRANVHVLTLTATPIPRTLQMALAGVREMSIIATPPVDRLAVRTFVLPYDPMVLREAIRRERFRGGQIFYVCPRVADLDRVRERLRDLAPDASVAMAHGRMGAAELEIVMSDFVDGKYDILLSTNIVESGLDIPNANTMIVHRSDMFGLAQLYQLRGRIGRGKQRAYCYLTLPPGRMLSETARKRLDVMQTLDGLGAGFTLASHDLDIRGAGNLLGDEQSGQVREVGVELYQRMLEEAVAAARDDVAAEEVEETWSPTITLGTAVLIPEKYVGDLSVRLGLYRRLSALKDRKEIDAFAVELVDRFGAMPREVENLLEVVAIKQACKRANVEKIDAGPKGAVVTFRNHDFPNPQGLIGFIQKFGGSAKLRPDHKMVLMRNWEAEPDRLKGARNLADRLSEIAALA